MKRLSIFLRFSALWPLWNREEQVWNIWGGLTRFTGTSVPDRGRRSRQPANRDRERRAPFTRPCLIDLMRIPGAERSTGVRRRREKCINLPASERNSWKGSRANDFLHGLCSNTLGVPNKLRKMLHQDAPGAEDPRRHFEICHFHFLTVSLQA